MGWTERAIYGAQGELGEARNDGGGARTRRARAPSRARLQRSDVVQSARHRIVCIVRI